MGSLRVIFWGTRGLISSPRSETAIFGGNTPCIEIRNNCEDIVLVDSGFGISNYGEQLMQEIIADGRQYNIHILYTHFHWDHIQGLPFFQPIYFPQTKLHLYSPLDTQITHDNLNILFDGSYSPFAGIDSMPSEINLHPLQGPVQIGDLDVRFCQLDHGPQSDSCQTFAYRFDTAEQKSAVIVTDHEARPSDKNDAMIQLANNCDLLVHDAQYTAVEYQKRVGWGHSHAEAALDNAIRCQAHKTLLTHHDPSHNDSDIQKQHWQLKQIAKYQPLDFEFAREELEYAAQKSLPDTKKVG